CARHDAFIVEDDIYGLYAASGRHTYKEAAPERVYYLSSLSKCVTPLVRLGVLAPPAERIPQIAKRLRAEIWGAAPHALEMGCSLLELGAAESTGAALRKEAKARAALTASILKLDHLLMP